MSELLSSDSCNCKAEHWQPHADSCPKAATQKRTVTSKNDLALAIIAAARREHYCDDPKCASEICMAFRAYDSCPDETNERLRAALQRIIDDGDYTAPEGMKRIAHAAIEGAAAERCLAAGCTKQPMRASFCEEHNAMIPRDADASDERYPQHVKKDAYRLDPECWVSYSGKPKAFKQSMEVRRVASLEKARAAQKAFVQLCAPHGKDWLTCPECAKAAGIGAAP